MKWWSYKNMPNSTESKHYHLLANSNSKSLNGFMCFTSSIKWKVEIHSELNFPIVIQCKKHFQLLLQEVHHSIPSSQLMVSQITSTQLVISLKCSFRRYELISINKVMIQMRNFIWKVFSKYLVNICTNNLFLDLSCYVYVLFSTILYIIYTSSPLL